MSKRLNCLFLKVYFIQLIKGSTGTQYQSRRSFMFFQGPKSPVRAQPHHWNHSRIETEYTSSISRRPFGSPPCSIFFFRQLERCVDQRASLLVTRTRLDLGAPGRQLRAERSDATSSGERRYSPSGRSVLDFTLSTSGSSDSSNRGSQRPGTDPEREIPLARPMPGRSRRGAAIEMFERWPVVKIGSLSWGKGGDQRGGESETDFSFFLGVSFSLHSKTLHDPSRAET